MPFQNKPRQHVIINRGIVGRAIITQYDETDQELCAKFWRNGEYEKGFTLYGFDLDYLTEQARATLDFFAMQESD